MPEPELAHYIRVEFPPDATEEERDRFAIALSEVVEKFIDTYDYDISVSGGAWYPPQDEDESNPYLVAKSNLRRFIYGNHSNNSPTDAYMLLGLLDRLRELGMSKQDMIVHLECERAINDVALRNMAVEENLLDALNMVHGTTGNPAMRVPFQAGTQ